MNPIDFTLLLKLVTAHLVSDFIFQSNTTATEKNNKGFRSKHLYFHTVITSAVLFLLLWDLKKWPIVLIITISHFIIDGLKSKTKSKNSAELLFLTDQLLHLIVILVIWLLFTHQFVQFKQWATVIFSKIKTWWTLLGLIAVTMPSAVMIGTLTTKWSEEITDNSAGLKNAGKWIGIIERLLIYIFVMTSQMAAVGFLLTAKSVLRFGDLTKRNEQKLTEYIIIGTFLSFAIAIFTGLTVRHFIR